MAGPKFSLDMPNCDVRTMEIATGSRRALNASSAVEPDWKSDLFLTVLMAVVLLAIFLIFGR